MKYITIDIWKVLRMVFYLSNRFTNPIMFGIILKGYLPSMLWHKLHYNDIMQTRTTFVYYCKYIYCLYTEKNTQFQLII